MDQRGAEQPAGERDGAPPAAAFDRSADHSGHLADAQPPAPLNPDVARRRRRRLAQVKKVKELAGTIAAADPAAIESATRRLGDSRPLLAPVAWAAGTIVLLIRGIKLLFLNWRLTAIQLVPALWIWIAMWDLKQHGLRGEPFRHVSASGVCIATVLAVAVSVAAFWCNTVFAFAIETAPPLIRPAITRTRRHLLRIVTVGVVLGVALASATVVVPRINSRWLYVVTLGSVLGAMLISFVAVPAAIIGHQQQKLPLRQAMARTATGWIISGIAMAPGFVLDRLGLILLGVTGFHIVGLALLSLGTALYAAGMSAVKAVKLTIKLAARE